MASQPDIFLVGAGYIGLTVLRELLNAGYSITVLTRHSEQASELEKRGIKTVLGSLSDADLITAQTAAHRITINTASCDDLPSVEAILAGVRQRASEEKPVIYLHTSGTGVLEDGAGGAYKSEKVYHDTTREEIDALPEAYMHRHVDIPIARVAQELGERAKIAVILPPFVYGIDPTHPRQSMALPIYTRFALKHGYAGHVGDGLNVWSLVHVKDLARAFIKVLGFVESSPPSTLLENPWFFAENGTEASMLECAQNISRVLHKAGKLESPKVQVFSEADFGELFGPFTTRALGCNSRSSADRLRALGWTATEKGIWESFEEDETPRLIKEAESQS